MASDLKILRLDSLQTQSAMIVTDAERRIEWVNESFTRLTGYTMEAVRGKNPSLLHGADTDGESILRMRQKMEAGEGFVEDLLNYKQSGEPYLAHLEISPLRDENNVVIGFLGIHSDITGLKNDYTSLRNFRIAVEESLSTIVITDLKGIIRYVNPAFEQTSGYRKEEAIGQHTRILKSGRQDGAYYAALWHQLAENKHWEGVFQNRRKDGSIYWEYASISEVKNDRGEATGYIAIKQDITRQKNAELELVRVNTELKNTTRYAEKMARNAQVANQAKSTYLAKMSHEIRTPMSGVIGMTELLLDTELNDEQRDYLETIRDSGQNLLELINNILDLSKIEAGHLEIDYKPFALRQLVESAMDSLRANADRKGLVLNLHIEDSVPDHVMGDSRCLRQILINLVGNAIKFTEFGEVETVIKLRSHKDNRAEIDFSVRDSGMGIEPKDQAKLFIHFSQANNNNNGNHPAGTGLGLAICKEMIELMDGRIGVRSPLNTTATPPATGAGSEFWFSLTLETVPLEENVALGNGTQALGEVTLSNETDYHPLAPQLKDKRLLIVEDNATNRLVAELMLRKLGYPAKSAVNGREAIELMRSEHFDLVLMDIQMPVMDGLEATRLVRAAEDFATPNSVPIVAVTAHAMSRDRDSCLRVGMNAFLPKPVAREQLAETIAQLLG